MVAIVLPPFRTKTFDGAYSATRPYRDSANRTLLIFSLCATAFWYYSSVGAHTLSTPVPAEHGMYTPVIVDKTIHKVLLEFAECSNLALAPANVACLAANCEDQLYIVFIRCNESRGKRWGTTNVMGLSNISTLDLHGDPSVATTTPIPSKRRPHATARSHYHSLLDVAAETRNVHSGISGSPLWVGKMFRVEDTRDVRIFHVGPETCVTTIRFKSDVFVVCYPPPYERADGGSFRSPAVLNPSRVVEVKKGARNIVPLVEINHQAWTEGDDIFWLFDPMGSRQNMPAIFSFRLPADEKNQPKYADFDLHQCEHIQGWRGNTPVIKLTDTIWITIVHKRVNEFATWKNQKGRSYVNKVLLLEADKRGGHPVRCTNRNFQSTLHTPRPFVFLLGLVYAGVKKNYMGENYSFIASGAVDDFMPVLHAFTVFLPRRG